MDRLNHLVDVTQWPVCSACGRAVRPGSPVLYQVVGWERERSAGGTNHVIARKRTGRIVGSCCAGRIQAGVPVEQEVLFDA